MQPYALSVPEACKALGGCSRATLYRLLERNKLSAYKLGSRTFVTRDSIESLIASSPRLGAA